MKNKKKKGFTLIELLAIIVILAIIAVITVPIILNIIDNSKKGAAQDSAYGFKDAVNKAYVTQLSGNSDYNITDGTYTVSDLKTQIGLSVSGKEPGENSWVTISKNNVTTGCLQYDDFKVEFTDGKVSNTEKGECEEASSTPVVFVYASKEAANSANPTTKTLSNLAIGDYAKIGNDGFYVIGLPQSEDNTIPTYNKVLLLAEYNISNTAESGQSIAYRQDSSNDYEKITFSENYYWTNCIATTPSSTYTCETPHRNLYPNESSAFVYDSNSDLYAPMENYKNYLKTLIHDTNINNSKISEIRPMSLHEADSIKSTSWYHSQEYWLGNEYFGGGYVTHVPEEYDYSFSCFNHYGSSVYAKSSYSYGTWTYYGTGIRPLLEVSVSAFEQ